MPQGKFSLSDAQPVDATSGQFSLSDAQPEQPSAASRFFNQINPMNVVHALFKPSDDPKEDPRATFGKNAIQMVKDIGEGHLKQAKEAEAAFKSGDYTSAIGHSIYALIPVIGPIGAAAGEDFANGRDAEGFGKLTSILGPKILKDAAPAIGAVAGKAADVAKDAGEAVGAAVAKTPPVLAKVAGGSVGAALGHASGVPEGGVLGYFAGKQVGAATLNKIKARFGVPPAVNPEAPLLNVDAPEPPESASLRGPVRPPLTVPPEPMAEVPPSETPRVPVKPPLDQPPVEPSNVPRDVRGTSDAIPEAYADTENTGLQMTAKVANKLAVANRIADQFRTAGVTAEDIDNLEALGNKNAWDLFWNNVGSQPGVSNQAHYSPSVETISAVREALGKPATPQPRLTASPAPAMPETQPIGSHLTPEQRLIAEKLAQEMTKPQSVGDLMRKPSGRARSPKKQVTGVD